MQFINVEEDGGLLPALQKYFKSIIIPQISKYDKWGPLVENKQGNTLISTLRVDPTVFRSPTD